MRALVSSWFASCLFLCGPASPSQSIENSQPVPAGPPVTRTDPTPATSHQVAPAAQGPTQRKSETAPLHPASLFDSLSNQIWPVTTTVEVHAGDPNLDTIAPAPLVAGGDEIINSAGTYGDVSRYLQLLPGVVPSSDYSNQVLVRGGHPLENLFLVDDIEVPNVNHLATVNSTGGFGPMIDAAAIQGLSFYTGGFDAKYPERLSSVTELRTLESSPSISHFELDFGIQGIGGLTQTPLRGGDLLFSAHHGLMDVVSKQIGIDGVPSYTNELTRYRKSTPSGARFTLLNLAGWDSIEITPCASNHTESSSIESEYDGWRETTGLEWQHPHSSRAFSILSVSDSEQFEHINQEDQIADPLHVKGPGVACPIPDGRIQTLPIYSERSNNAFTNANYRYEWATSSLAITAGTSAWLHRPDIQINQPAGAYSPYSSVPVRADMNSFSNSFSTGESGTFAQAFVRPLRSLSVSAGGRLQTFAFGSHTTVTPRVSARYNVADQVSLHATFARYEQLPPFVYLLAYPVNRALMPMRVSHRIGGLDLGVAGSQFRLEAYDKVYSAVPASTEYPAITMHTVVDMVGQQIVWLPMNSSGTGRASGIELSGSSRFGSRFQLQGSVGYSRAKFAGTDQIVRPSNFDFPWIVNAAGLVRIGRGVTASSRYGYASGRPYTPYDLTESMAQNRPVYDLSQVNVPRAPFYSRLDVLLRKEVLVRGLRLDLYGGVDNVLNRSNFLTYAWLPRSLARKREDHVATLWQTPIFPNFGVRLIIH